MDVKPSLLKAALELTRSWNSDEETAKAQAHQILAYSRGETIEESRQEADQDKAAA